MAHNVLVLLSDEHDPRIAGHAGHPLARTPNLDRLAAEYADRWNASGTAALTPSARIGAAGAATEDFWI